MRVVPSSLRKDIQQIPRHQQNLRHLLSSARRTGLFSICSCSPFAKVAHEKFGLVEGLITNILVGTFPLQNQGLLHELS